MAPLNPQILETDVDALSPVDDYLMGAIRTNLIGLDAQITGGGSAFAPVVQFKLNGPLDQLPGGKAKRVDVAYISNQQTLSNCQIYLDVPGTSGTLELDLRKITAPRVPITGVVPVYQAQVQNVYRAGVAMSTQSVTRTTEQIATQAITQWKPTLNVVSIVSLGSNLWQYNLSAAPDDDWVVGDYVTFASCADAANNGSFQIVRVNDYGSASVIVTNSAGVSQDTAAGTCVLNAYAFTFVDPVNPEFVAGEAAYFAGHTDAGNNGLMPLYAVNRAGNNLIVKNASGKEQSAPLGTVDVCRFSYNFSTPASTDDFIVGERLSATGHSGNPIIPSLNDLSSKITAVNNGGNNVQVYNLVGYVSGAAQGSVLSNHWIISLPTDPNADVVAGEDVYLTGLSSASNVGQFTVVKVNRSGLNNIVVYNTNGVQQSGVGGTVLHTKKLVKFASNQSDVFSTDSWVEIQGATSDLVNTTKGSALGHHVLDVNRGGGANYNVVVKIDGYVAPQASQAGWVSIESRSIFSTTPKIEVLSSRTKQNTDANTQTTAAQFSNGTLPEGTKLALYVLSVPSGGAYSLGLQVR